MPDMVLIEGPPDANNVISLLAHEQMKPPVAMLVYASNEPKFAAYYPFTQFSPEYQAICFAVKCDIPVRFMDLPQSYGMQIRKDKIEAEEALAEQTAQETTGETETEPGEEQQIRSDPLGELAKAAGYQDGERWWEHMVENRQNSSEIFEALTEAMAALREAGITSPVEIDDKREAYMRRMIREAQKAGYERIAVVCGAWHAPALAKMPSIKHDHDLLKGLKAMKVEATFTPWTHGRLMMWSGYGAGILSPGWYQHLWDSQGEKVSVRWLTKVAHLLREEDLSASPAQVIDAVRLADTLATLRQRPVPGLEEFSEAALTVFCFGNTAPLKIIHEKLIVGEVMGAIPDETPMVPLQRDLKQQQERLGLKEHSDKSILKLDLRKDTHLERSHLLHRLNILGIAWGKKVAVQGQQGIRGTFTEIWELQWQPELTIRLIEMSIWGNTIEDATSVYAKHAAKEAQNLPQLTDLIDDVLLAHLPDAVEEVVRHLQAEAAATGDIKELMAALPRLADTMTYGNVRQTDAEMVGTVVDGIVIRTCIGLPTECALLDDDAAMEMFKAILSFNSAIYLLDKEDYLERWHEVLRNLMEQGSIHGMISGRACRILMDGSVIDIEETKRQMRLSLSIVEETAHTAAWLEGFLHNSGLILIHDASLLRIIDEWVIALTGENFEALLPLLRRTFSTFEDPERRQIGRIISGHDKIEREQTVKIDEERANAMLPILEELLGINFPAEKD
jgi:hypothetical protein